MSSNTPGLLFSRWWHQLAYVPNECHLGRTFSIFGWSLLLLFQTVGLKIENARVVAFVLDLGTTNLVLFLTDLGEQNCT